jgi:hypothetical protein
VNEWKRLRTRCETTEEKVETRRRFVDKLKRNGHMIVPRLDLTDRTNRRWEYDDTPIFYLSVPFVDDAVDTMTKRALSSLGYNIRISHKSQKLDSLLYKPNQHPPTRNGQCNLTNCVTKSNLCFRSVVVYEATCSTCQANYIGSTKKFLHNRLYEHFHQRASHIYRHNLECGAPWSFKVRCSYKSLQDLRWAEALIIKKEKPTLNIKEEGGGLTQFLA